MSSAWPAAEHGREDAVNHVLLAHDPLRHLRAQPGDRLDQALELAYVVLWCGFRGGHALSVWGLCEI